MFYSNSPPTVYALTSVFTCFTSFFYRKLIILLISHIRKAMKEVNTSEILDQFPTLLSELSYDVIPQDFFFYCTCNFKPVINLTGINGTVQSCILSDLGPKPICI